MATRSVATGRGAVTSPFNLSTGLTFNGIDGLVTIADNAAYSQPTTGSLTISAWLNPTALIMPNPGSNGNFVHWMSKVNSGQTEWAFRFYMTGNSETPTRYNRTSFYVFSLAGGEGAGAAFEDTVIPGQWIHVVGTVDTQYVSIFKNGRFQNKEDWVAFPVILADGTAPIRIGTGKSGDGWLQGSVDDVRIWNRVLAQDEIKDLYNTNKTISSGLIGWWKLDEGSGTAATDSSSTANNGTLSGGATYSTSLVRTRKTITENAFDSFGQTIINRTNSLPMRRKPQAMTQSLNLISASSQYASIADASQSGLNVSTHDFMIGGWFKIGDTSAVQVLMAKYSGATFANNTSGLGWELLYRGDLATKALQFRFNDGSGGGSTQSFSGYIIAGKWIHLIVVATRAASTSVYINGVRQSNSEQSMSSQVGTFSSTGVFDIGRQSGSGTGSYLNGYARDVFLYDFGDAGTPALLTLQANYIEPIYYDGVYNSASLVSRWTLDNTTNDSVGSNNLTLTGSPTYSTDVPITSRSAV